MQRSFFDINNFEKAKNADIQMLYGYKPKPQKYNYGELKIIPRHTWDPYFPKFYRGLNLVPRSEYLNNPRTYIQTA